MKKTLFLFLILGIWASSLKAQICYSYDAAGNRTSKYLGPCPSSFIVAAPDNGLSTAAEAQQIGLLQQTATAHEPIANPATLPIGKLFPNPNNGRFELQLEVAPPVGTWFSVYDMAGQLVLKQVTASSTTSFDLSSQPVGEYILYLHDSTGMSNQWKVIKQ